MAATITTGAVPNNNLKSVQAPVCDIGGNDGCDGPGKATINEALQRRFVHFVMHTPARRLSRNLRKLVLEFSLYGDEVMPAYWKDLNADLLDLFELLDAVEDEAAAVQQAVYNLNAD